MSPVVSFVVSLRGLDRLQCPSARDPDLGRNPSIILQFQRTNPASQKCTTNFFLVKCNMHTWYWSDRLMQQKRNLHRWFQVSWYVLITFLFETFVAWTTGLNTSLAILPLPPIRSVVTGSLVMILCLTVSHTALKAFHFDPRSTGPIERTPDSYDHTESDARIAND